MVLEFEKLQRENVNLTHETSSTDTFWSKLFERLDYKKNYENIRYLIINLLCVSHGQAEVERHFSIVGPYLSNKKTKMTERTYNAVLNVLDALSQYDNKPQLVSVTNEMVAAAKNARKMYEAYIRSTSTRQNNPSTSTSSSTNDNEVRSNY